ncbi:unnamed protein product, partial [Ectocarpus sp. 12 AP-2014]
LSRPQRPYRPQPHSCSIGPQLAAAVTDRSMLSDCEKKWCTCPLSSVCLLSPYVRFHLIPPLCTSVSPSGRILYSPFASCLLLCVPILLLWARVHLLSFSTSFRSFLFRYIC